MVSMKFSLSKIAIVLKLIKLTRTEARRGIDISDVNLNAWPEPGDLADFLAGLNVVVMEQDEDGELHPADVHVASDNTEAVPVV